MFLEQRSLSNGVKRSAIFFLLTCAACSRSSSPSAAEQPPNVVNPAVVLDAGNSSTVIDAATLARADCAEPKKLTQLATVNEEAKFAGELLEGDAHAYDPETGAAHPLGPKPVVKAPPSTKGRYAQVADGWGLIWNDGDANAKVEDVATKKKSFDFTPCAAGGAWGFSLSTTGRFLICSSNRSGDSFFDLGNGGKELAAPSGGGVMLSPNDAYAVAFPTLLWATDQPTRASITYFDLDTHKSRDLAKAAHLDMPTGEPNQKMNPYSVSFCGAGTLFVASTDTEVVVYRGKDGARLAAAPALKGGQVSFSQSGKYLSQSRNGKTTVFRLDL